MLPEETVKLIQETAVSAAGAALLDIPGDPRGKYLVIDGKADRIEIPPALRAHKVCDLGELCRYLVEGKADGDSLAVVWHSPRQVVAILNDYDRRDRLTLDLEYTAAWGWIMAAAAQPAKLSPKEFLTLLRTKLAECVDPGALLTWQNALRNVRLKSSRSTDMQTDRGLEKLGREIEEQCVGADAIPETLELTASIYRNAGMCPVAADVAFDVSIDYGAAAFVLTAIGDRVANAVDGAQEEIGAFIRANAKLDAVFYGNP